MLRRLFSKSARREAVRAQPFPPAWRDLLTHRWPLYARLPERQRRELEGHTLVLLREKHFEGCGGMELGEEHRVLVAAQAALLLLGRDTDYFSGLRSILIYPSAFVGKGKSAGPGGMVTESRGMRAGESWHTPGVGGPVVLSWSDVVEGAANDRDARNVVLHEFAHQLDGESQVMEGIPLLESAEAVEQWRRVLHAEWSRFVMMLRGGAPTAINPYGAQSAPEFFACAVEAFLERPEDMRALHGEMYELLRGYFKQDPSTWTTRVELGDAVGRRACAGCA